MIHARWDDLETKRLELLEGARPQAVRVSSPWAAPVTNVDPWPVKSGVGAAAGAPGVQFQHAGARHASDRETAFSTMVRTRVDAVGGTLHVRTDPERLLGTLRRIDRGIQYASLIVAECPRRFSKRKLCEELCTI